MNFKRKDMMKISEEGKNAGYLRACSSKGENLGV
jgi:hypothetical protein